MDFFDLRVPVPQGWKVAREETERSEILRLDVDGCDDAVILILPPLEPPPDTLSRGLEELIAGHTQGRELVNRFPEEVIRGATAGGMSFAAQHAISTSDEDVWFAMYWALATRTGMQCAVGVAVDEEDYERLLPLLGGLMDKLELS